MRKNKKIEYYIISGLLLNDNNRGTAALGYGSFPFLRENQEIGESVAADLMLYRNPWKFRFKGGRKEVLSIGKEKETLQHFYIWFVDYWVYHRIPMLSRFTKTSQILKKVRFVAVINGGDGFSDIYGTKTFESRLFDTKLAMREQIPLIILPQTLGPFKDEANMEMATKILKYASKVYVRDLKFKPELNRMGVSFELTKDLSYYMEAEKFEIDIRAHAVGLNVSGLCYSNSFRDLSGCFDHYPQLIARIIQHFQKLNVPVYLLSHSYNYNHPESFNDDMQASKVVYEELIDKTNVYLIDKNLTSRQTKYIISLFEFFIGTRMHSNFAAIYTKTPVFGLAYSYKYEGAFDSMGLKSHYASVLNMEEKDIDGIVLQIGEMYQESLKKNGIKMSNNIIEHGK